VPNGSRAETTPAGRPPLPLTPARHSPQMSDLAGRIILQSPRPPVTPRGVRRDPVRPAAGRGTGGPGRGRPRGDQGAEGEAAAGTAAEGEVSCADPCKAPAYPAAALFSLASGAVRGRMPGFDPASGTLEAP
jgi:hypothetical protein